MRAASFISPRTRILYRKGPNGMAERFHTRGKFWRETETLRNEELTAFPYFKSI